MALELLALISGHLDESSGPRGLPGLLAPPTEGVPPTLAAVPFAQPAAAQTSEGPPGLQEAVSGPAFYTGRGTSSVATP